MDILSCNWDTARFFIFSENVFDPLVYYSHLLPLISALVLGFFIVFQQKKNKSNMLFFLLSLCFSTWVFFDLILWASEKPGLIMFFWSSMIYFEYAIFVLVFMLIYQFLYKTSLPKYFSGLLLILFIPVLFFMPQGGYDISAFDLSNCDRGVFEGVLWTYVYGIEALIIIFSATVSLKYFIENKDRVSNKQEIIFSLGAIGFMFIFFIGNLTLVSNLPWEYEQYKLFGMLFFLLALLFLIVKFKTFNTKVLSAQALLWIMSMLIAAQFFLSKSALNKTLNAITLFCVVVAGYYLVRSVKQVDTQRELLEISNQNQQSLIHFITHQIKGYMTKSRNIFDGMLSGDYGDINDELKKIAQHGFDSDTQGVETVQAILKASDLKSGKILFDKSRINISKLVAQIAEKAKESATKKGLDFSFDIEPNLEAIIDVMQIGELFTNLINNAIIYTEKGEIKITLKERDSDIRFSVIDTGFGLTNEDKENLFTEGGKSKDALSVNVESTGYGLFISKKITEEHNGKIGAHSEGRNKGSEFFVILPRIQ
jgi:signal transduction histidine kinase